MILYEMAFKNINYLVLFSIVFNLKKSINQRHISSLFKQHTINNTTINHRISFSEDVKTLQNLTYALYLTDFVTQRHNCIRKVVAPFFF